MGKKSPCLSCKHKNVYDPLTKSFLCNFSGIECKNFEMYEPNSQTNADKIRSMTDEELAEYLYSRGNDSEYCYGICAFQDECKEWKSREFCIEHIVKWLKQEVNK